MPKFKPYKIDYTTMTQINMQEPKSLRKLNKFLQYWQPLVQNGYNRNQPNFGKNEQGIYTGKWHRTLNATDILYMCAVLRYQHCNGVEFTQYELDFIQGMEDMIYNNKKRNNKQGWQLAMHIIEKIL